MINLLGYILAGYLGYRVAKIAYNLLYPFVVARILGLGVDVRKLGEWAVVTGGTDGIGKAYAIELAKRGLKIFLLSRNSEKLQAVAKEIREAQPSCEVRTHTIDFGTSDLSKYDEVEKVLAGLDIGLLVNNVGVGFEYPERFADIPGGRKLHQNMINVNSLALTEMTNIVLPSMLKKNKGAVINLSSASSIWPSPLLSTYAGTKAFVNHLTKSIAFEYRNSNVIIQLVCPFYVVTNMSQLRRSSFFAPMPESFVKSALATLGIQSFTLGCLAHALQFEAINLLTCFIPLSWIGNFVEKGLLAVRGRALKKKAKSQ